MLTITTWGPEPCKAVPVPETQKGVSAYDIIYPPRQRVTLDWEDGMPPMERGPGSSAAHLRIMSDKPYRLVHVAPNPGLTYNHPTMGKVTLTPGCSKCGCIPCACSAEPRQ